MARARNIKPSFFDNEKLAQLPAHARLLFIGLWTLADCQGKLEDRPMRIKKQILGYENVDVDSLLKNLEDSGFIQRYTVQGQPVILIPNFLKHQTPHKNEREKGSELPDPPPKSKQVVENKDTPEKSRLIQNNPEDSKSDPADSLNLNPDSGILNPDSCRASPATKPKDELWEAMLDGCGLADTTPTKSERGAWNKALKEIRDAGADPPEVRRRCAAYKRNWPKVSLTPTALARRWNECTVELPGGTNGKTHQQTQPNAYSRTMSAIDEWERNQAGGRLIDGETLEADDGDVRP